MRHIILLVLIPWLATSQVVRINKKYYEIHYSMDYHVPLLTKYKFYKSMDTNICKRSSNFSKDPTIDKRSQPSPSDYSNTGYDRGHLVPNDDMRFSQEAEKESMIMTNIAPQNPFLNGGVWREIEEYTRNLIKTYDTLIIFTGVILDTNKIRMLTGDIAIPDYFYKIIVCYKDGDLINIEAFLCQNTITYNKYVKYKIKLADLETRLSQSLYMLSGALSDVTSKDQADGNKRKKRNKRKNQRGN